ncbi:YjjI family glycine radical enzyme [Hypnocyclicus thermotrophus]|uniref:YjjI family glycine radical enzyme n=1 Tax=Hypnocyclicus thermotrophus TaxID=1627895 RepID=A0AA46I4V9_9FUSO|nr:YjjI family glycine radical enzyme [Hypnocyclicus thermotrophus]TDT67444.1 YjjI family glycine radical enzyme [Hypnocyclicus thermotrophus]
MNDVIKIIKNKNLSFEQKVIELARYAENSIAPIELSNETKEMIDKGIICDLFEGNAPYRPRYIIVDFNKFMKKGSTFLELSPPKTLLEAVNNLLIFYKHIPSITTMPVYIGNIDYILEPFIKGDEDYEVIKLFLNHIDKTITDSFCHANIGPKYTKAGELILKASKELQNPTPNITLKYDENITPIEFAKLAIETSLITAKPSFANDKIFRADFNGDYAIASCYNGLKIGGGSHTLVRSRLFRLAKESKNIDDFLNNQLVKLVNNMTDYMDKRIKFIVEESGFFESNFLVKEEFIKIDNFTAMFGIVGLAEAVNYLLKLEGKKDRFGHSKIANELGYKIIETIDNLVKKHKGIYCNFSNNKYLLHAQVGIDSDTDCTPGCRIPIGEEPEIFEHIIQSAPFHKFFPSGIGDVFRFDKTTRNNLESILDIIKGGFKQGLRYISFYEDNADVVRITGYLVKRSEIEKLDNNQVVLRDTTVLGKGARDNMKVLERKLRK